MHSSRKRVTSTEKRIEELEMELTILKCTKPKIEQDDPYELLLLIDTLSMDAKVKDSMDHAPTTILKTPQTDPLFQIILNMFPGKTVVERKHGLLQFLKEHPAIRTGNLHLLRQRIYMWKNYKELFEREQVQCRTISEVLTENEPPALVDEEEKEEEE